MKKVFSSLMFLMGLLIIIKIYSSENVEEKRYLKFFIRKPGTHWTYPLTHRLQHFQTNKYNPDCALARNYTIVDIKDLERINRASAKTLVLVGAIKEKTSGEHEYWNQFINGYVLEEEFNNIMHSRKLFSLEKHGRNGNPELSEKEILSLTHDIYENSKEAKLIQEYKQLTNKKKIGYPSQDW